jgi:hypothetical protein
VGLRALAPVAHGELGDGTPPSLLLDLLRPAPISLSLCPLSVRRVSGRSRRKIANRPAPRRTCAPNCESTSATFLLLALLVGRTSIYSDLKFYPYDRPPLLGSVAPLPADCAEGATAPCGGSFRFFGAFCMRVYPAGLRVYPARPCASTAARGSPPRGNSLVCSPLRRLSLAGLRALAPVAYAASATALVTYARGTPQPLTVLPRPNVALLPRYLVLMLRWRSPCPAGALRRRQSRRL